MLTRAHRGNLRLEEARCNAARSTLLEGWRGPSFNARERCAAQDLGTRSNSRVRRHPSTHPRPARPTHPLTGGLQRPRAAGSAFTRLTRASSAPDSAQAAHRRLSRRVEAPHGDFYGPRGAWQQLKTAPCRSLRARRRP